MNQEDARKLLPMYADGLLDEKLTREIEALLDSTPELQDELTRIKEEESLLSEALSPLHPSRSARIRLSDAMLDVHQRVEQVAGALPPRGWRYFRIVFAAIAIICAVLLGIYRPVPVIVQQESLALTYGTVAIFVLGLLFFLGGTWLARLEAYLLARMTNRDVVPTRLEILTIEIFGLFAILAAGLLYLHLLDL